MERAKTAEERGELMAALRVVGRLELYERLRAQGFAPLTGPSLWSASDGAVSLQHGPGAAGDMLGRVRLDGVGWLRGAVDRSGILAHAEGWRGQRGGVELITWHPYPQHLDRVPSNASWRIIEGLSWYSPRTATGLAWSPHRADSIRAALDGLPEGALGPGSL